MKCLSIQQPWASLICSGVKDVENRLWKPNENPGKILIHAGKVKRTIQDLSLYYDVIISDAMNLGILPQYEDMPLGAIIGWAEVIGFEEDCDSIWAGDKKEHGCEWKWKFGEVGVFKNPIPAKGKLGLYEVPEIDEHHLPECLHFYNIERNGSHLTMPVSSSIFNDINSFFKSSKPGNDVFSFSTFLLDSNLHFFTDEDLNPLETKEIKFINNQTGESLTKEVVDLGIEEQVDANGEPILFEDPQGQELSLILITYYIK